ncbi:TrkA family potassium uptake protein [Yaniella flava]|uniref:TrkA family potassium uptake protein n=1 Tax=Yaniella flava TaxID=287930 RepID=A0ABP5G747_9MICC
MVKHSDSPVLVIGLGRFGTALAQELTESGQDLMAVEQDRAIVQRYSGEFTSVVQADATDIAALEQLGAGQFEVAVVGIGTSIENSVLTVANLVDLGVQTIWAKAITRAHGTILTRIGASQVIFPEQDAGERTAHLLAGTMRNFTEFSPGYALANISSPAALAGKPLRDLRLKDRFGVTVVAVERDNEFQNVFPATQLVEGQNMIVAGPTDQVDEFAKRI